MKRDWFKILFIDYPIGFILILVVGIWGFLVLSSGIVVPTYETVQALVLEDEEGTYLELSRDVQLKDAPIYLYQERDTYIEKVDDYYQKEQNDRVYLLNTEFNAGDTLSVDIETEKVELLKYIFTSDQL